MVHGLVCQGAIVACSRKIGVSATTALKLARYHHIRSTSCQPSTRPPQSSPTRARNHGHRLRSRGESRQGPAHIGAPYTHYTHQRSITSNPLPQAHAPWTRIGVSRAETRIQQLLTNPFGPPGSLTFVQPALVSPDTTPINDGAYARTPVCVGAAGRAQPKRLSARNIPKPTSSIYSENRVCNGAHAHLWAHILTTTLVAPCCNVALIDR